MNAPLTQETRPGRLETVLGKNVLSLTGFEGHEALNAVFEYTVGCVATSSTIDFDALLGTHATVFVTTQTGSEQAFDGVVTEARWTGRTDQGESYSLLLRPWFYLASFRRNQRIFHNKNVLDILQELLGAYADIGQVDIRTNSAMPELEYTVQYRESDMDFACRLMERHGLSYHFEHSNAAHLMVISDDATAHHHIGERPYKPQEGHHLREIGHLHEWEPSQRITTGAIRLTDFNFKKPTAAMEVDRAGDAEHAQGRIESYDFPGDYLDAERGAVVSGLKSKSERGQAARFDAKGDVVSLRAGHRMTLGGDPAPGHGAEYICLGATHSFRPNAYRTTSALSDEDSYAGSYLLMPAKQPMVPERKTSLAEVKGPQTGTVVGEGEIDCDEFGRILVHLHWDLDKAHTMRCRVSQNWASKGWGGMVIPRIGMEVVVEFLEGDPDKPLVTGCVYNGKNMPPYELPEHKTRSTFKTDTHEGKGFNELRFEDEKDREEIFLHAQKDRNTKVENNQSERVNVNKVESIGHDKASEIGNTWLQVVDGNMELRVGPGNIGTVTPSGVADQPEGLGTLPEMYGKVGSTPGDGDLLMSVERHKVQSVGVNHDEQVGTDKTATVGRNFRLEAGSNIEIVAGDMITLRCGQSVITMADDGTININGKTTNMTMDKLVKLLADAVKIN